MEMIQDEQNVRLQVFAPTGGKQLTTTYAPLVDEIVKLGADVNITLGGILVPYLAGDIVGLKAGQSYTLSLATDAHVM